MTTGTDPTASASVGEGRAAGAEPARLKVTGLTKRFGDLVANGEVDLEIAPGVTTDRLDGNIRMRGVIGSGARSTTSVYVDGVFALQSAQSLVPLMFAS